MLDIARVIGALKDRKHDLAVSALERPKTDDGGPAFQFGRAAGVQEGFQLALEEIEKLLNESDAKDADL